MSNQAFLNQAPPRGRRGTQLIPVLVLSICIAGLLPLESFAQPPLASGRDKFLGCGTSSNIWSRLDWYWNQVTPGNDGKWGSAEPGQGVYNFTGLDKIYNYAVERGFPFKEHTLVWGNQQPSWISLLDSAGQRAAVENWIRVIGQRYPAMSFVDVVNEPMSAPPSYMNALGGSGATGWDWVITAFQWARQYCAPGVKLILNEYNILHDYSRTATYINIINLLKDRGLIDGIGVQGHYFEFRSDSAASNRYVYPISSLQSNLNTLAGTGLPVYITEFDIDEPVDAIQLLEYQIYFPLFWNHPGVKGITLWGYVSNDVWTAHPNTFVVWSDGTERPALQWLRTFLSSGNFVSHQTGNWNDAATWSQFDGTNWINPAPALPSLSGGAVTIANTHTVTLTASDTTNKLTINIGGTLVVNPGVNLVVKKGPSIPVGLRTNGSLMNHGTVSPDTLKSLVFGSGGKYAHERSGGVIPLAQWASGSTCQFDSVTSTLPSNVGQNFGKVVWNCPDQSGDLSLNWHGVAIGGSVTVQSTGAGQLRLCAPLAGVSDTVTISGDLIQSGGQFTANGSDNANTAVVVNHGGNVTVTGGDFSISRGSQGGSGTTTWNLSAGNFSMSNAASQNLTTMPNGARFVFSRAGRQTLTLGAGNSISSLPIEVRGGTTLGAGTSVLTGSGLFSLNSGATLECGHAGGLDSTLGNTGTRLLSTGANYTFNGTSAQVTGSLLPDSVAGLTVNNTAGLTMSRSLVVNGSLIMQKGSLSLAGNTVSYGPNGTLVYSAASAQTTASSEFPAVGGPKNLSITNTRGVTLHAGRAITGNASVAGKLWIGDNDFAAASISNTSVSSYIVTQGTGALKLASGSSPVLFPVGTKTGYAAAAVTNAGVSDTLSVSVLDDSAAAPYGGRVMVRWNIGHTLTGAVNDTIGFVWSYSLQDDAFTDDMLGNARIYRISGSDTTEAGFGAYTYQLTTNPYSVSRGGFKTLGTFAVGSFGLLTIPSQPLLVSPVGSTNEPRNAVFVWRSSVSATSYRLQVANDNMFSSLVVDSTVADTLLRVNPLAANTQFYWHVCASNQGGASAYSTTADFTTGDQIIAVQEPNGLPREFGLSQNYPNPFNPSTVIRYQLPTAGDVVLRVYDLVGKEVATLAQGRQSAGYYNVTFDARNLPSGIYFCWLQAGDRRFVKKMLLLK